MKGSIVALSLFSAVALAAPEAWGRNWGGKHWGNEHKDHRKGGWGKYNKYEPECPKEKDCPKGPIPFTSTYSLVATPDQVYNGTTFTGGQKGAIGYYDFGLNSDYNLICYHIRIHGLGDSQYQSAAKTSTHVHEAPAGAAGPPRLAFPNPQPLSDDRLSVGCLQGPFTTGIMGPDGKDTGAEFQVRYIEENPKGFFADVHTMDAVPGAVRGQIA